MCLTVCACGGVRVGERSGKHMQVVLVGINADGGVRHGKSAASFTMHQANRVALRASPSLTLVVFAVAQPPDPRARLPAADGVRARAHLAGGESAARCAWRARMHTRQTRSEHTAEHVHACAGAWAVSRARAHACRRLSYELAQAHACARA
eukprot:3048641-Pleurochrysis_carterae.AAC.2